MEIRFLPAGCGDAIHVRFEGNDGNYRNILIDGGAEQHEIYHRGIRQALVAILERKEVIDLWIITHIDDDHIGGILRFIQDKALFDTFDLSKTVFWYNAWHSDYAVKMARSSQKSVLQGIRLRDFLNSVSHVLSPVTDATKFDFYGAQIIVLSPSDNRLRTLLQKWEGAEALIIKKERDTKKSSSGDDYDTPVADFDATLFSEDQSEENGSSIAFILSYRGKSVLFSADSHPSVICESLRRMGCSETNRLKVEFCQVPHHGSKYNTSPELVSLIDTSNFVINANGYNRSSLPNKETIGRIIHFCAPVEPRFYITHKNRKTSNIFKSDKGKEKAKLIFPQADVGHLVFHL